MENYIKELIKNYKQKRILKRVVSVLCVIVLLMTVDGLKRMTDALSRVPMCGMKEHVHSSACYDGNGVLICGKTEHQHTDACYQVRPDEAAMEDYLEVEAGGIAGIPEADSSVLASDVMNLDLTLDDMILDDSSIAHDDTAAVGNNNNDAGKPKYTLGKQARLSEIIKATGLKIKPKSVKEVGVVDIDGTQADLLLIEKVDKDYTITALKDFDSVDLALVLKSAVVTVTLVGGVAPAPKEEDETPADQSSDTPVVEGDQLVVDISLMDNEQLTVDNLPAEDSLSTVEDVQNDLTLDISLNDLEQDDQTAQNATGSSEAKQTKVDYAPNVELSQEQGDADSNTEDGQTDAEQGDTEQHGEDQADQGQAEPLVDGNEPVIDEAALTADEQTEVGSETDDEQSNAEQIGNVKDAIEQSDAETLNESSDNNEEQGDDDSHADDEQSGDDQVAEQSGDEQIVEQSGDDQAVEQSGDDQAVEQFGDDQAVEQSGDDQADEQVGDEQVVEQSGDEQTEDKQADKQASDEQTEDEQSNDEQSNDEQIVEQSGDEQVAEQSGDEQVAEQFGDEQAVEQSGDEQIAEQSGDEQVAEQSGDEQTEDKQADKQASDEQTEDEQANEQSNDEQSNDEQSNDEQTNKQTEDEQANDEQSNDEQTEDKLADEQSGDEQSDEESGDALIGEEQNEGQPAPTEDEVFHPIYTATIDLSDVETYPLSLRQMMASAEAANADAEAEIASDTEAEAGETEEKDAGDFSIAYDEALLSIEAADEDELVAPLQSFDETTILVNVNASRYELTLLNCTLENPDEPEQQEPEEQEEEKPAVQVFSATIDLKDVETYPLSLNGMIATAALTGSAADDEAEIGSAPETEDGEEEAEEPASVGEQTGYSMEYDSELLSVEEAEADYLVMPLSSFDETVLIASNESVRYELTLVNCVLEEQGETAGEATEQPVYTAAIDLSEVEIYPLSLREMMEKATSGKAAEEVATPALDNDTDSADGPDANDGETAEPVEGAEAQSEAPEQPDALPLDKWAIEYDQDIFTVEMGEDDYLFTPVASFGTTQIKVANGSRYELTLMNCTLPEPEPEPELTYPAQHFEESTETMKVIVDAPEGAFPEGTTMSVADVVDQQTISDIEDTVAEDFVEVKSVHAVDISFWYNGGEIEPLQPINVVMNVKVKEVEQPQDPVVVHVSDEGAAEVVDSEETGKAEVSMEMPAGEENTPEDASAGQESAGEEGAPAPQESGESVAFSADSFSVYAVVFTEIIETRFIDAAGETWNISVGYTKDANIPAGATLLVSEVMGQDAETYLAQTAEALRGQETITLARFFDITILDEEGREVQPAEPVEVRATLADGSDDAVKAVHFDDGGEMQILDAEHDDEAVTFNAESFSVYGIVYTVDFHWNANGEFFEYSIVGGGAMSLRSLVEIMDVLGESPAEGGDEANSKEQSDSTESAAPDYDAFMAEIESVTFSDETLVKPVPVTEDTTAAALIEQWGLEPVYSAELTEEDIATLNAAAFRAPDWALVSLKAFDSEESLSIAMRNGDTITIRVTDAQLTKTVISASGQTWLITVTYGRDAGVPEGAELEVSEILPDEQQNEEASEYDHYVLRTEEALGYTTGELDFIRLFDIKIVDENGEKVEIAAPVDVKVELADQAGNEDGEEEQNTQVVHFADGSESGDVVDIAEIGQAANTEDGTMVRFEASGFSVYAIVSGPSGDRAGWKKLTSLEELTSSAGYYIGHTSGYYLTNTTTSKTSGEDTIYGIKRTAQNVVPTVSGVEVYYFENAPDGKYYVYCKDGADKKYVVNKGDANLSFGVDENDKTPFTVEVNSNAVFKIHNGDWYWNMKSDKGSDGFYSKDSKQDGNNNLYLWEKTDPDKDTYGLNGMSYGFMTWTGGKTAKALMAIQNTGVDANNVPYSGCLAAKFLTVMTRESKNVVNRLYVPNNTSDTITKWTFEWAGNDPENRLNSYYYLRADNGSYLKISAEGLSLVGADEKDESCKIQAIPGTGNKEGQICLKSVGSNSKALTYSGEYAKGYNVGGTPGSEWLYLVEDKPEALLADYEKVYTATKVSVSDTKEVNTGAKIIIYARQWLNDHYEYFAINSKGELVPCVESGDKIEWYGGNVNDMLWQFTEYVYEGTNTPNGYYELENLYARSNGDPSYLAPKYSDKSILSPKTVGVLLQGRTDQQYYSPIVAWDTPEYMYSALTVDLNQDDPVLEPCVRVDGLDFYFAIMDDLPVDDVLHTVPTVDNNDYGIVMKMKDFTNGRTNEKPSGSMNAFLQDTTNNGATYNQTSGLLTTKLGENGYPETTRANSGGTLADLYAGATDANHLFIESTYRATGYYEYNSTQNFAYLTDSGDFRVYQELGTNDTTSKKTLQHGEFFPYNDIEAGRFASANPENLYKIDASDLDKSDPRRHEQLYLVKPTSETEPTDYYFGMELEASFYQTPSGLDAWGHDIIFEFSGDDDFWLYVDGELVLDLGGIHSAMSGDVNFRTGVVHNNGTTTSLYEVFKKNYTARGEADSLANIDNMFKLNSAGQRVFKDNTPHTMRIFYMERGAGASNLHMKFNLATVKKGTVELSKKLEGVSDTETTHAVFPYQVYYTMEDDTQSEQHMLRNAFDPDDASAAYPAAYGAPESKDYVFYKGGTKPVTFLPELEVDGATYYNVFLLKPDDKVVINFPTRKDVPSGNTYTADKYRIVECGINPDVYTEVTVNGGKVDGVPNDDNSAISDYGIPMTSIGDRPKVDYVNKVEKLGNLTFTKELYRKLQGNERPQKIELYESDGKPIEIVNDPDLTTAKNETFDFRLYFKTPYDKDFSEAVLYTYHVKDPEGYYCAWNKDAGCFVRITNDKYPGYLKPGYEDGTTDYANLTDDTVDANGNVEHHGKFWASLETGLHGSISGIPAYYTVEVLDLIPGTKYRIIERPSETPEGYKFWQYEEAEGRIQNDPGEGITGTIKADEVASAVVKNYKGYGFRLEKVWEDASTMQNRDPAYFALYKTKANGDPDQLVTDSVRQLAYSAKPQKLYWWYLDLPFPETGINDYAVFEVILDGGSVAIGNDGVVSGYQTITPIPEGGNVMLNGTPKGQSLAKSILYKVTYAAPENIGDNVRAFKATNSPAELPPVQFVKTDWDGKPLEGATFSLVDGNNVSVFGEATKTSDANGLIASNVYLQPGAVYTLTELASPQGYVGIKPLKVWLETTSGFELKASRDNPEGYSQDYEATVKDGVLTLIAKNRPYEFDVVKVGGKNTNLKLAGAKFSLYKQQTIGNTSSWDENNPVFSNLCTDDNGVIPSIDENLPAGVYQLRETDAPSGYQISGTIDFTVWPDGLIELGNHPKGVGLTKIVITENGAGKIRYELTIPDDPVPVKLRKVDDSWADLKGAKFALKKYDKTKEVWKTVESEDSKPYEIDMTSSALFELTDLQDGWYELEETGIPEGYVILEKYVYFDITTKYDAKTKKSKRVVTLTDQSGTVLPATGEHVKLSGPDSKGIYTINIRNIPGVALPDTGGMGTAMLYAIDGIVMLLALIGYLLIKRKARQD